MEEDNDTPISQNVKFNAGFFQIQRIHEVQRMINIAKINPTSFNHDYNLWNYRLWFNSLNTLLDEVWPKLSQDEKESATDTRTKMIQLVSKHNVVEDKKIRSSVSQKMQVINEERFSSLHMALIHYDNFVKELLNSHGWNNPDYDEDDDPY